MGNDFNQWEPQGRIPLEPACQMGFCRTAGTRAAQVWVGRQGGHLLRPLPPPPSQRRAHRGHWKQILSPGSGAWTGGDSGQWTGSSSSGAGTRGAGWGHARQGSPRCRTLIPQGSRGELGCRTRGLQARGCGFPTCWPWHKDDPTPILSGEVKSAQPFHTRSGGSTVQPPQGCPPRMSWWRLVQAPQVRGTQGMIKWGPRGTPSFAGTEVEAAESRAAGAETPGSHASCQGPDPRPQREEEGGARSPSRALSHECAFLSGFMVNLFI